MRWRKPLPRSLPSWPVMRLIWGELVVGVWPKDKCLAAEVPQELR